MKTPAPRPEIISRYGTRPGDMDVCREGLLAIYYLCPRGQVRWRAERPGELKGPITDRRGKTWEPSHRDEYNRTIWQRAL